jgi:uncharacterized membrane protein YraQ (UPF0718 family)/copper chaperone CopZ
MGDYFRLAWETTAMLAPWLFLGLGLAGVLHVLLPAQFIVRHLGRGSFANVVKAALFGVPMPLCSCGVIPAAIGLKKEGASDGAATSFLISTPQTGVDSVMVCAAFLGWPFALFKVASAFATGIVGGVLVNVTSPDGGHGQQAIAPPAGQADKTKPPKLKRIFDFAINDLLYGIWRWILLGILISAALSHFLPSDAFAGAAWTRGLPGMFLMLALSVPLYVCATGSVPIAASLIAAGLSPGTALVFLMAGPATNAATLGAVYKTFGRRITVIYLSVIVVGSMALGLAFNWVLGDATGHMGGHATAPGPMATVAALALTLCLPAFAWRDWQDWRRSRKTLVSPVGGEKTLSVLNLTVTGMTCQMCVGHVRRALEAQPHVQSVEIDLDSGRVLVQGCHLDEHRLREAVEEAGYAVADGK